MRTRHAKDDVSFNAAYNPAVNLGAHENPPFAPGFFILKIQIDDLNVVHVVSANLTFFNVVRGMVFRD